MVAARWIVDCQAYVSILDMVALAMVCRRHQFVVDSHMVRTLKFWMGNVEPCLYVYMQMHQNPSPWWFVHHPHATSAQTGPIELVSFPWIRIMFREVGLRNLHYLWTHERQTHIGSPLFDCIQHTMHRLTPMKMAWSRASTSLVDGKKIYVFGRYWECCCWFLKLCRGFWYETRTWDLLSVLTPKMPHKIQHDVVVHNDTYVHAVDEDGQIFFFSTSCCFFVTTGSKEFYLRHYSAKISAGKYCGVFQRRLFGRNSRVWKSRRSNTLNGIIGGGSFDIIKLCAFFVERLAIFWKPTSLMHFGDLVCQAFPDQTPWTRGMGWGFSEHWAVRLFLLLYSGGGLNLLYADFIYAWIIHCFYFLYLVFSTSVKFLPFSSTLESLKYFSHWTHNRFQHATYPSTLYFIILNTSTSKVLNVRYRNFVHIRQTVTPKHSLMSTSFHSPFA